MEATEKTIADILARLRKLEDVVFSSPQKAASDKPKSMSPKEFLIAKSVTSDPQRVVALGYFLERFEEMQSFNVQDLESAFRSAKVPLPVNINGTVNKCIGRGFLMEAAEKKNGKKAWTVTGTGEQLVTDGFKKVGK